MTKGLRWRVCLLQAGLIGVLGVAAAFAFWGSGFATGQVHDNLAAQQIYFPALGSPMLHSLPAADAAAMSGYAGQQMTTGTQAQTYADHFIGAHLRVIAGGRTYAQVSAASQADPKNAKLAAQVQLLFRGETLRGLLLNSYGRAQIGQYAAYAATVLTLAVGALLLALVYELSAWRRSMRQLTLAASSASVAWRQVA